VPQQPSVSSKSAPKRGVSGVACWAQGLRLVLCIDMVDPVLLRSRVRVRVNPNPLNLVKERRRGASAGWPAEYRV